MLLSNLLTESLDTATLECWRRERTAAPLRAFAVRLHAAGLSIRETESILRLLGVEPSFQAIFQQVRRLADIFIDPPTAQPRRVPVDETAVKINGKRSWLYAAIGLDTKVILDVALFERRGTGPAATFLHGVCKKHDCSDAVFLADAFGDCLLSIRSKRSGQLHRAEPDGKNGSHIQDES